MKQFAFLPCLLMLLQACSSIAQRPAEAVTRRADSRTIIYVARRGWHIDIGFRTLDIAEPLASLSVQLAGSQYLFFGFGDRHYLVARNKNFPGLMAALWPGAGLVLVTALAATPEEAFGSEHVIRLKVSAAEAQAAQAFVWDSMLQNYGVPTVFGRGPYEGSLFVGAVPKYSAVHTCNTWAAEVLREAGLPVHSRGVLFASLLWSKTRRIEVGAPAPVSGRVAPIAAAAGRDHD
jgi:hypothetical protein